MGTGADPSLGERIARGEYVVDPHAVAEAMLRRLWSTVLVAPESLDRPAVLADEDEPVAGDDLA
jgi:hypothetical protein